jgi:hypothetical protein
VLLLWRSSLLLMAILLALAALMGVRSIRLSGLCLVSGALLGLAAEGLGVRVGAWSYAAPDILGTPVWLPVLWGLVCLGPAAKLARDEVAVFPRRQGVRDRLVIEGAAIAITLAAIAVLWRHDLLLSAVTLAAGGAVLAARRRPALVLAYIGGLVLGPVAETLAIDAGAWSYTLPRLGGAVPYWLGPVWGLCAVAMTQVAAWMLARPSTRTA